MVFVKLFLVFLWKNLLFVKYNRLVLCVVFGGCLGVIWTYLKSTYQLVVLPEFVFESKPFSVLQENFPLNYDDHLFYAPTTRTIDNFMETIRIELQIRGDALKPAKNATEMKQILEQNCSGNCFGINFENFPISPSTNDNLRYAISSAATRVSPKKHYVNDEDISGIKEDDDYVRTGFFTLQHIIDRAYMKSIPSNNNINELNVASLPIILQKTMDGQRFILFGSIYSILFSVLLLSTFLVSLVEEKQDGLKEFLVIATPLNCLNGVTFFLVRLVMYVVFLIVVLILAANYVALGITPLIYVVLLFVLYMLSAMSYAYFISVFFNSVFYCKIGGLLMFIMPYVFHLTKGSLCTAATFIFGTKTFLDGLDVFQIFTNKHRNFNSADLFSTNITESSFKIASIYAILIAQCLLNSALYNYLYCVFPGPGGLKKPYNFFLKSSFYKKKQRNQYTTSERSTDAIIIQDLVKKFKTPTRDINIADRLNMVIRNKQITVLLGHNGVGKTTTLNMIMGSEPKDSGTILVCSERDVTSYRHLIGFCPQHCVFMNYMTCKQHLEFFAQIRGMTKEDAKSFANDSLEKLRLEDKRNEYGKNLSGGMKRRLSLGIALAGNTKVVVLDEPSSGLDIESRRELWDILLKIRKSKAILITTHHMEEAEVLGDTICILSNGCLQRTGSPLELKRKVGSGYILKLCVDGNAFDRNELLIQIRNEVAEAKILNEIPPTILISLPYAYKPKYKDMLQLLERKCKDLGIKSISMTDTSLEDVFLNCATEMDQVDGQDPLSNNALQVPYQPLNTTSHINRSNQLKAIFYKKLIFLRSEWIYTCIMVSLPIICTVLAILLIHNASLAKREDGLRLNLKQIKNGTIFISNTGSPDIDVILAREIEKCGIEVRKLELHGNISAVTAEIIDFQRSYLAYFLQNVIGVIAVESNENGGLTFNIYYSGNIYHSSVILLNLVDNVALQFTTKRDIEIETFYMPIRRLIADINPSRLEYYAVIVPIGFFFYMFFYVSLPFKENVSGFKNLQAISRLTYWSFILTFDILMHLIVCIVLLIVQLTITPDELYSISEQCIILASMFFYGCSYLPILYIFANSFRSISTISTYILFMFIVSAIVPLITSGNIPAMTYHETKIKFLSLLPDFNLNHQLRIVNENFIINRNKLSTQELLSTDSFFIFATVIFTLSMLFFMYIVEDKYKKEMFTNLLNCYHYRQEPKKSRIGPEEEIVLVEQEKKRVGDILKEKTKLIDCPLLVSNLNKRYGRKDAVDDVNFVVRKRECFGLLGVNGAGKTSTFQMITANTAITEGTIKIDGVDILEHEVAYKERFGYCPQHDCLNNFMSSYEILKYMAMLRGLESTLIANEVMYWLEKLDLTKYQNVEIRHYSGGTKRKLNASIAMIGGPSLVLLDEPTTGVDPVSRRVLWKCIQEFQNRDKTIVLTSHSMDECEHLCNRLAIMADGKLQCVGYVQDLKLRYGSGFTITVKLRSSCSEANVGKVTTQMTSHFPEAVLRENHAGILTYFIRSDSSITWSGVFERTEQFFVECTTLIEDYSVNESTLEDIILRFNTKIRSSSYEEV